MGEIINFVLKPISYIFLLTFTILVAIFTIIIVPVRHIVALILRLKHGDKFNGLMGAFDGGWSIDEISKNIIHFVAIQSTPLSFEEFAAQAKERVKEKCFKDPELFPKISSKRQRFLGFYYLLKCGCYDDFFQIYKVNSSQEYIEHSDLIDILDKNQLVDLPLESKTFLQVWLVDKPIRLDDNRNDNEKNYVVIFRLHHSIGDGFALTRFFYQYFTPSSETQVKFREIMEKKTSDKPKKKTPILTKLYEAFKFVDKIAENLPDSFKVMSAKNSRNNLFNRVKLSGEKMVAYYLSQEEKHVDLLKEIKNFYPDTTFSDVLFTALSAALTNYFKREIESYPSSFLTCYVPIPFVDKKNRSDKIILSNNFSNLILHLPIAEINYEERLERIKRQTKRAKTTPDIIQAYWFSKLISYTPDWIIEPVINQLVNGSGVVTIIPGSKESIPLFEKSYVKDTVLTLPSAKNLGAAIATGTAQNRVQLVITADKALIPNKDEAITILKDVLTSIEEFHQLIKQKQS